ncbi:PAS domain-containing protein [bacterium]|nr:PAS domain-containing protein [bacterium]
MIDSELASSTVLATGGALMTGTKTQATGPDLATPPLGARDADLLAGFGNLLAAMNDPTADIETVAGIALDLGLALSGAAHGLVGSIDPSTRTLHVHAATTAMAHRGIIGVSFEVGADGTYGGLWGHALNTGRPFLTNSPVAHAASTGLPRGHVPLDCFLAAPALYGGTPVGLVALANHPSGFGDEHLAMAIKLAEILALAAQRTRELQALRQSEARYRHLFEGAIDATLVIDRGGRICEANVAAATAVGTSPDALAGRMFTSLVVPAHAGRVARLLEVAAQEGKARDEILLRSLSGHQRHHEIRIGRMVGEASADRLLVTAHDVEERCSMEQALSAERLHMRQILAGAPVVICGVDAHGEVLFVNAAGYRLLGRDDHPLIGSPWWAVLELDPDRADRIREDVWGGEPRRVETTLEREDGAVRHLNWQCVPRREADGQVVEMLVFGTDITDRVLAEQAARREHGMRRSLFDAVPDLVFYKDAEGRYLDANPAFATFVGTEISEVIGHPDAEFFGPDAASRLRSAERAAVAEDRPVVARDWLETTDGRRVLLETVKTPFADPLGGTRGTVGVARDVTARWHEEEAARRRAAALRLVIDAASQFLGGARWAEHAPALLADLGRILGVDRVQLVRNLTGEGHRRIQREHLWEGEGVPPWPGGSPDTYAACGLERWESILEQGKVVRTDEIELEPRERAFLQSIGAASVAVVPIRAGGRWWGALGVDRLADAGAWRDEDIRVLELTAAVLGSAVLRQRAAASVMEARDEAERANRAKSRFLANLGHEIRTPMHGILSYARFGVKKVDTAPRQRLAGYFDTIHASGLRLMDLLNDLLDLARLDAGRRKLEIAPCDLRSVVTAVASEVATRLSERGMTLRIEAALDLDLSAHCDQRAIGQVMRNLLTNAIHYGVPDSEIQVSFAERETLEAEPRLEVRVADRGVGVPPGEREQIFTEFVQSSVTSDGAGGTGLGLAICRRLIRQHHGRIWVEPQPSGPGSVFVFTLPRQRGSGPDHPDNEGARS